MKVRTKHRWLVGNVMASPAAVVQLADGSWVASTKAEGVLPPSCWEQTARGIVLRAPPIEGHWRGPHRAALEARPFTVHVFDISRDSCRSLVTTLTAGDLIPEALIAIVDLDLPTPTESASTARAEVTGCGEVHEDVRTIHPVLRALLAVLEAEQAQPFDKAKTKALISHLVGAGQTAKATLTKLAAARD
jgi:hypothetical protein